MKQCFVIQPFDNGKFDQRYNETFKPAIENAGLKPYRIDEDPSTRILIEDIEKQIRESDICFAEITTDNPNVWYELGYAFACNKDVVMVCSDERSSNSFPFDIRHKSIITYKTETRGGFEELEINITKKLKAFIDTSKKISTIKESPIKDVEGLTEHEQTALLFITAKTFSNDDAVSMYDIIKEMDKSGYTEIGANLSLRNLVNKALIEEDKRYLDYYGDPIEETILSLSEQGRKWILENQQYVQFKKRDPSDDLPF